MVKFGLIANFKQNILEWDVTMVHIKYPRWGFIQNSLNKYKIREVDMQTSEPASTKKSTDVVVKILAGNYKKVDINEVREILIFKF